MATGQLLVKFRSLYAKADAELSRWKSLQARCLLQCLLLALPHHCCRRLLQSRLARHSRLPPRVPQEQSLSLLGTIANILARLPALADADAYGVLADLPGLCTRLRSKQLLALERLVGQLRQCAREMEGPVAALAKLARDAGSLAASARSGRGGGAALHAAPGPAPSVEACLSGLQDIWCALVWMGRLPLLRRWHAWWRRRRQR